MPQHIDAPILSAKGLHKSYGKVEAVRGLDLEIRAGSCFGLLGPNGAGKTTTIEILEGTLNADQGEILYRGKPRGPGFRDICGIQFQKTALQDFMRVGEALELFARMYPRSIPRRDLAKLCQIENLLTRDVNKLSGGQRQRVLVAIAMINDPEIIFLDEPTTGLDPQARRNFWDLVHGIRARGKTVILTTHYMEEAAQLCDEIAIIDAGKTIASGSQAELLGAAGRSATMTLPRLAAQAALGILPASEVKVARQSDVRESEPAEAKSGSQTETETIDIETTELDRHLRLLAASNVPLSGLRIRSWTLEDLFLHLTGTELRA